MPRGGHIGLGLLRGGAASPHQHTWHLPPRIAIRRRVPAWRTPAQACRRHTLAEARALKLAHQGPVAPARLSPTLHAYALEWARTYPGRGRDTAREQTRQEYSRLLVSYVLPYFGPDIRLDELSRPDLQGFVTWLTHGAGRDNGRLSDSSIRNAVTPLRSCLATAVAQGLMDSNPAERLVLPRRRGGSGWRVDERRFLTRDQLRRLIAEVPVDGQLLIRLLASTGLRSGLALVRPRAQGTALTVARPPCDRQGHRRRAEVAPWVPHHPTQRRPR